MTQWQNQVEKHITAAFSGSLFLGKALSQNNHSPDRAVSPISPRTSPQPDTGVSPQASVVGG